MGGCFDKVLKPSNGVAGNVMASVDHDFRPVHFSALYQLNVSSRTYWSYWAWCSQSQGCKLKSSASYSTCVFCGMNVEFGFHKCTHIFPTSPCSLPRIFHSPILYFPLHCPILPISLPLSLHFKLPSLSYIILSSLHLQPLSFRHLPIMHISLATTLTLFSLKKGSNLKYVSIPSTDIA